MCIPEGNFSSFKDIKGKTLYSLRYKWKVISYLNNDSFAHVYIIRKEDDVEDYFLKLEPSNSGPLFCEFHFLNKLKHKENNYFLKLIDFGLKININGVKQRSIVLQKKKNFVFKIILN